MVTVQLTIERRADPTKPMQHPATVGDVLPPTPLWRRDRRSVSRQQSPIRPDR